MTGKQIFIILWQKVKWRNMESAAWKSCRELVIQDYHNKPTIIHHKGSRIFAIPKHWSQDEPTKGISLMPCYEYDEDSSLLTCEAAPMAFWRTVVPSPLWSSTVTTVSHPRKLKSSEPPTWEPQTSESSMRLAAHCAKEPGQPFGHFP